MRNLLLALIFTLTSASSFAVLGGAALPASAGLVDQGIRPFALQSGLPQAIALATAGVQVRQTQLPSGTQIREYLNTNNIVFAVAWRGPTMPNLQQLLGNYFQQYTNRPTATLFSLRNAELNNANVVVRSHGHLRAFQGKAFIPSLMPVGFPEDQIQ